MPRRLWGRWKRFAHRAAEIQSLVVLTALYWIVVVPVGLVRRPWRRPSTPPVWKIRPPAGPITIDDVRRQY